MGEWVERHDNGVQDDKVKVILTNSAGKWVLNFEAVAVYTQPKHGVSRDDFLIVDTGGRVLTEGEWLPLALGNMRPQEL